MKNNSYIFINKIIRQEMLNTPALTQQQIVDELNRLENTIFDKISNIKEVINDEDRWVAEEIAMKKQTSTELIYPKYDKKLCYYQEFWKVYLINEIMISKIKEYSVGNKALTKEIDELQETQKQWSNIWNQKIKKKVRRPSALIVKSYECPFPNCDKNYGTDVSLNLHMKLKHNSGTKTQRETLARQIILAEERGDKIKIHLTFPPGYLQKFRESMKKQTM